MKIHPQTWRIDSPIAQYLRPISVLVITSLAIMITVSSLVSDFLRPTAYRAGEVAKQSVRAPRDFVVEDTPNTERRRSDAAANVRRVFDFDDSEQRLPSFQLRTMFDNLSQAMTGEGKPAITAQKQAEFQRQYGFELEPPEWSLLTDRAQWPLLEDALVKILDPILSRGVIADKQVLPSSRSKKGFSLRRTATESEQLMMNDAGIYDLEEARDAFHDAFHTFALSHSPELANLGRKIGEALLKPNITYNGTETDRRIFLTRAHVEPAFHQVRKGEMIVRAGDIVSDLQEQKLSRLEELMGAADMARAAVGYCILTVVILVVLYLFAVVFWRTFQQHSRDLVTLAATLVGSFLLIRLSVVLGNSLNLMFPDVDAATFMLATPVAAGGMLLEVTLGPTSLIFFVVAFSVLSGVFLVDSWVMQLLIVVGNLVGGVYVKSCFTRSRFLASSLWVAFVNAIVVLSFELLYPDHSSTASAAAVLCAVGGGLASGVLAAGITPVAEFIGGYATNIRLLELASLDNPLLRDLATQAPGTWTHSMMLGQLAEAAAEATGANPCLARVGAYYHDIGKSRKPAYYVENQVTCENRHDKLPPSVSAHVIRSHVKDGIELAKQHGLPQQIIDMIPQHHGTALIEYFYDKAVKDAGDPALIDEQDYRYPGPKPHSKEAGILMLADIVEASSRVLPDPTPEGVRALVQKAIQRVLSSGQLDESELTVRDLPAVTESFTRVLLAIHHRRIQYPEQMEKAREPIASGKEVLAQDIQTVSSGADLGAAGGAAGAAEGHGASGVDVPGNGGAKPTQLH